MEFIKLYIHNLSIYDYIGLGIVGIVFFLFFILFLILLFKKPLLGFAGIIFTLFIPPAGIYTVYNLTNKYLRKSEVVFKKIQPLHFSNSLLLDADIKNHSKINFNICYIELKIIKKSRSKVKKFLYELKPLNIKSIYIYQYIPKNSSFEFKKILNDTVYDIKNDKLTAKIACY